MCNDLNEYDPFEPLHIWYGGEDDYIDSYPMEDDDWEEWLAND